MLNGRWHHGLSMWNWVRDAIIIRDGRFGWHSVLSEALTATLQGSCWGRRSCPGRSWWTICGTRPPPRTARCRRGSTSSWTARLSTREMMCSDTLQIINDNNICREVSVLTITIRRKSIRGWKNIFRNSVDNIIYSTWFVVDDDVLNKALSKHLMIKQNARDIIKISRILESRINISTFPLLYSVNNVRGDTSIFSWQGTLTTEWQSQSFNFDCIVVLCYGVITTI